MQKARFYDRMVMSESFCRVLFARRKIGVSQRRFTLQRGSSFLYEFAVSIRESNHLVNFLLKGGEQGENSFMGNENRKAVHIGGVGEEIRNRKINAQQHRKRQGVADIVSA